MFLMNTILILNLMYCVPKLMCCIPISGNDEEAWLAMNVHMKLSSSFDKTVQVMTHIVGRSRAFVTQAQNNLKAPLDQLLTFSQDEIQREQWIYGTTQCNQRNNLSSQ